MGFLTPDIIDEHDGLATFARQQVLQLATTLHGLDPEQLAATPAASELSVGVLARHVIDVATSFTAILAAGVDPFPDDAPETAALRGEDSFAVGPDDTAESLIAELQAAAEELGSAIRGAGDLGAPVPTPEAPWYTGEERWTVRWVALHTIEEVARHAGHADIIRETIDGKGAYELNALVDGEPWPPEGEW